MKILLKTKKAEKVTTLVVIAALFPWQKASATALSPLYQRVHESGFSFDRVSRLGFDVSLQSTQASGSQKITDDKVTSRAAEQQFSFGGLMSLSENVSFAGSLAQKSVTSNVTPVLGNRYSRDASYSTTSFFCGPSVTLAPFTFGGSVGAVFFGSEQIEFYLRDTKVTQNIPPATVPTLNFFASRQGQIYETGLGLQLPNSAEVDVKVMDQADRVYAMSQKQYVPLQVWFDTRIRVAESINLAAGADYTGTANASRRVDSDNPVLTQNSSGQRIAVADGNKRGHNWYHLRLGGEYETGSAVNLLSSLHYFHTAAAKTEYLSLAQDNFAGPQVDVGVHIKFLKGGLGIETGYRIPTEQSFTVTDAKAHPSANVGETVSMQQSKWETRATLTLSL